MSFWINCNLTFSDKGIHIYIYIQRIIPEINFGVSSHVSITLWCKLCSCGIWREGGGTVNPHSKTPSLFCYISLLDRLMWNTFLLTTHSNFSVINFKLGVQTYYPLSWMFFFHTLATAFPTFCHMKSVCSCRVWKLRCMPTEPCS